MVSHGLLAATTDAQEVATWWGKWAQANIGINLGEARLVALDIDDPSLAEAVLASCPGLPRETWCQRTPRGGLHLVAAFEEGEPPRTRHLYDAQGRRLGELRSDGAYILAWPSRTESGAYELLSPRLPWEDGAVKGFFTAQDTEVFLLGLLREVGVELRKAVPRGPAFPTGQPLHDGDGRNNALYLTGRRLLKEGVPAQVVEAVLRELNANPAVMAEPLPMRELETVITHVLTQPLTSHPPAKNGHASREALGDAAPGIYIVPGSYDLAKVVDQAWQALLAANRPPHLFRQGDAVVEVEAGEVRVVGVARMRELLARAACWLRPTPQGPLPVPPPEVVAQAMLERPHQDLPALRGVVRAPVVTEEGIIVTPGYDATTGLFYRPGPGPEEMPPVPDQPAAEDVAEVKRLLLEKLLGDFPFDSQASRAGVVAMLLTPFLRELIEGPTPLFLLDKPTSGAGATLLATVAATVATGEPPTYLSPRGARRNGERPPPPSCCRGQG
jgi:hypothetical protein